MPLPTPHKTLYELLEVAPNASPEVLRAAYRSLSQHVPAERAGALQAAYTVLSHADSRARYDASLRPAIQAMDVVVHPLSSAPALRAQALQQDALDDAAPVPLTGWGWSSNHWWQAVWPGWVGLEVANTTEHHAFLTIVSGRQPVHTVFVRSGEATRVVLAARPMSLGIVFGRRWDPERKGFLEETAHWWLRRPMDPPRRGVKLVMDLARFAALGHFDRQPLFGGAGSGLAPDPMGWDIPSAP